MANHTRRHNSRSSIKLEISAISTPIHIGGEKIKALAGGLGNKEIEVSESTILYVGGMREWR